MIIINIFSNVRNPEIWLGKFSATTHHMVMTSCGIWKQDPGSGIPDPVQNAETPKPRNPGIPGFPDLAVPEPDPPILGGSRNTPQTWFGGHTGYLNNR
jgi:hypothetical protein